MGSNREKSNIAIAILEKLSFLKGKKIISHFGGSNNIFAYCRSCENYEAEILTEAMIRKPEKVPKEVTRVFKHSSSHKKLLKQAPI